MSERDPRAADPARTGAPSEPDPRTADPRPADAAPTDARAADSPTEPAPTGATSEPGERAADSPADPRPADPRSPDPAPADALRERLTRPAEPPGADAPRAEPDPQPWHDPEPRVDWQRLVPARLRGPRMTTAYRFLRRIFLGDWHPVLRDPLDLLRLSFVVGAVIFAIEGDSHATTQLALTALAVFVARMVQLPRLFDWGFCIAMFFNGWGDALHLFTSWGWYDNIVHINLPMFFAPMVYIGLSRLDVVPEPAAVRRRVSRQVGLGFVTFCIGVTAVTFYEVYEWIAVRWLDQNLFISYADTIADIADGFLGSTIGALLLCGWALGRFSSRRPQRPAPRMSAVARPAPRKENR